MRYSLPLFLFFYFLASLPLVTMRNMKNKPKTSPKNLNSCNKTKATILYKKTTKRTSKKTTLKPINKGKINEGKPAKKPLKKPLNLLRYKNNCINISR